MNTAKKVIISLTLICSLVQCNIIANPTHVYVHNCTPLRFDVSIDYEGTTTITSPLWQKGTDSITPYDTPDGKNMVLSINRLLPPGEYLYTIKLIHGAETFYLKQKFISSNTLQESELGISLASSCLHDPWFMNDQAKERHEHLLTINGHSIVIVYYAYDNNNGQDIEYSLYEKSSPSKELESYTHIFGKTLAYNLAVPIIQNSGTQQPIRKLTDINPKPLEYLVHTILSAKSMQATYRETLALSTMQSQSLDIHIDESDILDLQKIIQPASASHTQLLQDALHNGTEMRQVQASHVSGQEIVDYIAKKESWYSVVDSTRTTYFWVPNKTAIPMHQ